MAGGVLCLDFPAVYLGFWSLKDSNWSSPFPVYNCMNYYENLVSIHNITNSTDLGDLIFSCTCFWVCLCDMALVFEAISHKLAQKGGNCLLIGLPVTSS